MAYSKKKSDLADIAPKVAAEAAGLHYVTDATAGITRIGDGKHFRYKDADGKTIRQAEVLGRIRALAIPPAWRNVWICTRPDGHLQATGRDARGRKQYRYHSRWREARDETKFDRMVLFGKTLPAIRRRVERDLSLKGQQREKILATIVRLLETTFIRVGNEEYARHNDSFGLTTMRDRHVEVSGSQIRFEFRGKSGIQHTIDLDDRRLATIVKRSRDLPGYELFQYVDEAGTRHSVDSADVNRYIRDAGGHEFTAKDFRTWAGTLLAAQALQAFEAFDTQTQAKRNVMRAIETVAKRLGNTKTVCRKCYIHPEVLNAYLDGSLMQTLRRRVNKELTTSLQALPPEEAAVLALLQGRLSQPDRTARDNGSGKGTGSLREQLKKSLAQRRQASAGRHR